MFINRYSIVQYGNIKQQRGLWPTDRREVKGYRRRLEGPVDVREGPQPSHRSEGTAPAAKSHATAARE